RYERLLAELSIRTRISQRFTLVSQLAAPQSASGPYIRHATARRIRRPGPAFCRALQTRSNRRADTFGMETQRASGPVCSRGQSVGFPSARCVWRRYDLESYEWWTRECSSLG